MNRSGRKRSEANAGTAAALRSVLRATGGNAKVEELYRLLTAQETAHFLGLAESTVRDMSYRHELPCVKTGARGVRYRLVDLIAWSEKRFHPARPSE